MQNIFDAARNAPFNAALQDPRLDKLARMHPRLAILTALERIFDKEPAKRAMYADAVMQAATDDEARVVVRTILQAEEEVIERDMKAAKAEGAAVDRARMAVQDFSGWLDLGVDGFKLQLAANSRVHEVKLLEAAAWTGPMKQRMDELDVARADPGLGVFLVQHDWASLVAKVDADDGEVRLPFDNCVFEFEVNGRRICLLVVSEDGAPRRMLMAIRVKGGWLAPAGYDVEQIRPGYGDDDPLTPVLWDHVRAIAITLDAEVVEAEVVRNPHRSNRQAPEVERKRFDHHVLSISARRRRLAPRLDGTPTGRKVRLHFRRGHWRHFQAHKTWIKWMLVGDEALGFVDKDYRL